LDFFESKAAAGFFRKNDICSPLRAKPAHPLLEMARGHQTSLISDQQFARL
jgi:hypothetical protein